jgi:hypothetical protein
VKKRWREQSSLMTRMGRVAHGETKATGMVRKALNKRKKVT